MVDGPLEAKSFSHGRLRYAGTAPILVIHPERRSSPRLVGTPSARRARVAKGPAMIEGKGSCSHRLDGVVYSLWKRWGARFKLLPTAPKSFSVAFG